MICSSALRFAPLALMDLLGIFAMVDYIKLDVAMRRLMGRVCVVLKLRGREEREISRGWGE